MFLDLRLRYRGSVLGFLWTLLNPLLLTLVLWLVFSRFGRVGEKNYALFLLSALMAWTFFQQSIEQSLTAIVRNGSLIRDVYLPKLIFPLAVVLSNLINFGFFLVAYTVIALPIQGVPATALLLPAPLLMLFLLSLGGATLISSLNVFFRDFTHITTLMLRVLFYLTPIIFTPEMLGERLGAVLKFNPMFYPVTTLRSLLYYGVIPETEIWVTGFATAAMVLMTGIAVFAATEKKFVYYA